VIAVRSAVDAHVGRHIFESCINGCVMVCLWLLRSMCARANRPAMQSATRVLVTHQLQVCAHTCTRSSCADARARAQYLHAVDRIVVLSHGRVEEQGSYDELMNANGAFSRVRICVCRRVRVCVTPIAQLINKHVVDRSASQRSVNDDADLPVTKPAAAAAAAGDAKAKPVLASMQSVRPGADLKAKDTPKDGKLIANEEREIGSVSSKVLLSRLACDLS
jgi:ABC-type sulfate/molybdate transport systems ATPase subunit